MKKNSRRGNFPTESQALLLNASLCIKADEAEQYFFQWLSSIGLDKLDINSTNFLSQLLDPLDLGSQRLIPLLHENLSNSSHPYLYFLKGYRKKIWFSNKQIEFYIQKLQTQLALHSIPSIIFKGQDYATNYYPSFSSRPMNDGDLLIRLSDKEKLFSLCKEKYFDFKIPNIDTGFSEFTHAIHLEFPNNVDIDLHWNLFPEYSNSSWLDNLVWNNTKLNKNGSLRLSETISFFMALTHGKNFDPVPPIRWITDSMLIYRKGIIDWDLFYNLTKTTKFKPFILSAIDYLATEFSIDIPEDILLKLHSIECSNLEMKYYDSITMDIRKFGIFSLLYYGTKRRFIFYNLFLKDFWPSIWRYLIYWYKSRVLLEFENFKRRWNNT